MKAQIKFQKILSLLTIVTGAIVLIYALCFFSGNLSDVMAYKNDNFNTIRQLADYAPADDFIYAGQGFVSALIVLGIVYICAAAAIYITATNSRRNYYVTNYVAIGLVLAVAAAVAVFGIIYLSILIGEFTNINWEEIDFLREFTLRGTPVLSRRPEVSQSLYMFIIGYAVSVIVIINAVLWALNLTWKVKLMKGEKELLELSAAREVS